MSIHPSFNQSVLVVSECTINIYIIYEYKVQHEFGGLIDDCLTDRSIEWMNELVDSDCSHRLIMKMYSSLFSHVYFHCIHADTCINHICHIFSNDEQWVQNSSWLQVESQLTSANKSSWFIDSWPLIAPDIEHYDKKKHVQPITQWVSAVCIAGSVTHLKLDLIFNHLSFQKLFLLISTCSCSNKPLMPDDIPPSVTYCYFDQPIPQGCVADSVIHLEFGWKFNQLITLGDQDVFQLLSLIWM